MWRIQTFRLRNKDLWTTHLWSGIQAENHDVIQNDSERRRDALRSCIIKDDIVDCFIIIHV